MSQLALARPLLQIKEKEKEKKNNIQNQKKRKRKEILNNDLAVLPSHDTHGGRNLVFLVALTSIGTLIDGVDGRGFRMTRRDRAGGNLITDIGEDWVETVLVGLEGVECNTD